MDTQKPRLHRGRRGPRVTLSLVLVAGVLNGACASARSTTEQPTQSGTAASQTTGAEMSPYARQALYRPIAGACRATLRADRAVIVGGIIVSGIKPTETALRLDRQLDVLKTLADEENVTLRLVERVRAARPANSRQQQPEPYVVMQRIELETRLDHDIDRLLERALQTGLNRYGSAAGVNNQSSASRPLVVYRFSDLDGALRRVHDDCRVTAVHSWCEAQAGTDVNACVTALETPALHLVTEQLLLTSQPVTRADGSVSAVQVLWPHVAPAPVHLGSDGELRLSGSITLRATESFR